MGKVKCKSCGTRVSSDWICSSCGKNPNTGRGGPLFAAISLYERESQQKSGSTKENTSKKWKIVAAVLIMALAALALVRILTPAEPPTVNPLSPTQRNASGTVFSVSGSVNASQGGGGVETGIEIRSGQ